MKATGVIVRFLSLLDVVFILLGVLMIALMQSQLRTDENGGKSQRDKMAELVGVDFVYILAGCTGPEKGRCYLLRNDFKAGQEIQTSTAKDIEKVFAGRRNQKEHSNQAVMLLFEEDAWDAEWTREKLAGIENTWKVKVIPVYGVQLERKR